MVKVRVRINDRKMAMRKDERRECAIARISRKNHMRGNRGANKAATAV